VVRDEGPNQVDAVPPGDLPDEGLFSSDELLGSGEITNVSEGSAAGVFHCAGGHVGRSPVVCSGGDDERDVAGRTNARAERTISDNPEVRTGG
jgi:hypothetical protein